MGNQQRTRSNWELQQSSVSSVLWHIVQFTPLWLGSELTALWLFKQKLQEVPWVLSLPIPKLPVSKHPRQRPLDRGQGIWSSSMVPIYETMSEWITFSLWVLISPSIQQGQRFCLTDGYKDEGLVYGKQAAQCQVHTGHSGVVEEDKALST